MATKHGIALPHLEWVPTKAFSSRHGETPRLIAVHRWSGGTLQGVESWFENPADNASAHLVYAGETGRNAGRCAQMVKIADKAWTEAGYNPVCISIECADAIWLGLDPAGFYRTARIVAFLAHHYSIPVDWPTPRGIHNGDGGIVRHADLGALGGSHPLCPTDNPNLWLSFMRQVKTQAGRSGFRDQWTR